MKKILLSTLILFLSISHSMAQWNYSGSDIYYTAGRVGIGTTSPIQKLQVHGGIYAVGGVFFADNSYGLRNSVADYGVYPYSTYLQFRYAGSEAMRITSAGNVGVGTVTPSTKLYVDNGISTFNRGNSLGQIAVFRGLNSEQASIGTEDSYFLSNLGIGTTLPAGNFQSYISATRYFGHNVNGADLSVLSDNNTAPVFKVVGTGNADLVNILDGSNEVLTILDGGNVGIGTTSPGSKLEIKDGNFWIDSNTNVYSVIDRASSDRRGALVFTTSGNSTESIPSTGINWSMGMIDSDEGGDGSEFFIGTTTYASSARFWMESNGNLGLGISNPSEKLEVNGTIRSKKVKVEASGWPDYVFSPNYELKPLKEVERFIQQNQHLPEVPSAKEVEANGLDLGDMEVMLLKKIEELTLYTIEQQKLIENQSKENQALKSLYLELKKEIESIKKQ